MPLLEAPHYVIVLFGDGPFSPLAQRPLMDFVTRLDVVADEVELREAGRVLPPPIQGLGQRTAEAAVSTDNFELDVLGQAAEVHGRAGSRGRKPP